MSGHARAPRVAVLLLSSLLAGAATISAQDPSFVATPLTEMGLSHTYLGFAGGLYPNGSNAMPADHASAGDAHAAGIRPLDANGDPSPDGRIVLLSIGMSHTTQEFCAVNDDKPCNSWTFVGQSLTDTDVHPTTVALVNGAHSGHDAKFWIAPNLPDYDRVRDVDLAAQGVTEAQVQAVWLKEADIEPTVSLPDPNADAYFLESELGEILRAARVRYPNLQCVFIASRSYAGYALTTLNPEPYAYESGFAVKWLIQAQIDQMANGGVIVDPRAGDLNYDTVAPWIAWGPYLWADGTIPRGMDGLTWQLDDFDPTDRTHPSTSGETKVGTMLLNFFKNDPRTKVWFPALRDKAVSPTSGSAAGAAIELTGTGFQPGATLTVGALPALDVTVTSTEVSATTPVLVPGTLNDVVLLNTDSTTGTLPRGFFADFLDVPQGHVFHGFVESILRAGVTAGCGGGNYCVDSAVTRAEMSVLLLKGQFGPFHAPPPATGAVFGDVHPGDFAADWIEELASLGITAGCGSGDYCPADPVSRAEMAVFLLKTLLGSSYAPPDPTGVFADVPVGAFADRWIEDLYNRQITGGCAVDPLLFCPGAASTRGEMAVFLTKTFALP